MASDVITLAVVLAGTGAGAAIDLRTRRVPDGLSASIAGAGLALAATGVGRIDPAMAATGCLLGLLLMLPGYLFGGTGAGDVKLFAATGTLLGPTGTIWAFVFTLIAGGAIALLVAAHRGRLLLTFQRLIVLVGATHASPLRRAATDAIEATGTGNRFAYAPAITVGAIAAAVLL